MSESREARRPAVSCEGILGASGGFRGPETKSCPPHKEKDRSGLKCMRYTNVFAIITILAGLSSPLVCWAATRYSENWQTKETPKSALLPCLRRPDCTSGCPREGALVAVDDSECRPQGVGGLPFPMSHGSWQES